MVETNFDVHGRGYNRSGLLDDLEEMTSTNPIAEFIDNGTYMQPIEAVFIWVGTAIESAFTGAAKYVKNLRKNSAHGK